MNIAKIVASIDAETERLDKAKALLTGNTPPLNRGKITHHELASLKLSKLLSPDREHGAYNSLQPRAVTQMMCRRVLYDILMGKYLTASRSVDGR